MEGAFHQLQGPTHQVAQVVGEVRVVPVDERLVGVARVLAEGHLPHEKVAHRVHSKIVQQGVGLDDVAAGLGHLRGVPQPPAVGHHAGREGKSGRQKKGGPVDRVEAEDVLADQVDIGWPEPPVQLLGPAVLQGGDVVGQGVEPDVKDVPGV